MNPLEYFDTQLTAKERRFVQGLRSPVSIQTYLNKTPYLAESKNNSPLQVMRKRVAHCLDGGLFAAAMLRYLGYPPLIVDLKPDPGRDDDHVLALYRTGGYWGAVAKSNYTGLRYREPIYHTLRELVISYFEDFYNACGEKTLRTYTRPINLIRFDRVGWMWSEEGADIIEEYLKKAKLISLITPAQAAGLSVVDELSFQAGRIGINLAGVFQPKTK